MRPKVIYLLIAITTLSFHSCSYDNENKGKLPKTALDDQNIHILLFGAHPLLTSVSKGIQEGAKERLIELNSGVKFEFTIHDASFKTINTVQQTKVALLDKATALVPLGTPCIVAALANRPINLPLFFGATSSPKVLNISNSDNPDDWKSQGAFTEIKNVYGLISDFQFEEMTELLIKIHDLINTKKGKQKIIGYPITPTESNSVIASNEFEKYLARHGFKLIRTPVNSPMETTRAARDLISRNVSLIQIGPDNTVVGGLGSILTISTSYTTPVLASDRESVVKGAIAAIGIDFWDLGLELGRLIVDVQLGIEKKTTPNVMLFDRSKLFINTQSILPFLKEDEIDTIANYFSHKGFEREDINDH